MDEYGLEINKNKSVFQESVKTQQNNYIQTNKMDMRNNLEINKKDISDPGQKIEDSYIEENEIKKKGKEAPPDGPKHVALERRFSYDREDDKTGMKEVRRKIKYYFKSVDEGKNSDVQAQNLQRIIDECKNYCKGKFMFFKFGRAKERLQEVKALKQQAEAKLQTLPSAHANQNNLELIHNNPEDHNIKFTSAAVIVGRFTLENLIRIPLTLLTLPVWAINEGVRKIQKDFGQTQNRRIRLPWMHTWTYYKEQQYFKKNAISFSTYRSFSERFIKHNTDFKAMDRAARDLYSTTEDGFDYSDDDEYEGSISDSGSDSKTESED